MPEEPTQVQIPAPKTSLGLSKNAKIAIGVAVVLILLAAGVFWWMFKDEKGSQGPMTVNTSTDSAKTATESATPPPKIVEEEKKDETAGFKPYSNTNNGYSVKYPPTWQMRSCEDNPVFFAPEKDLLGICNSGFGGLVGVSKSPTPGFKEVEDSYTASDYDNFKKETVSLGGKAAVRISGTSKIMNEIVDERGTKRIVYLVELGASFLSFSYSQDKAWSDYSKEFEQMVSTFDFL